MQSAHFAIACNRHLTGLASFLSELLAKLGDGEEIGVEPYQVPRRLIDPKFRCRMFLSFDSFLTGFSRTGDLLLDPVCPDNTPNLTFVNKESKDYFEAQTVWPTGSFISSTPHFSNVAQVKEAVAEWVRAFAVFLSSWTETDFIQDFGEGHSLCEGCSFLEGKRTNAKR